MKIVEKLSGRGLNIVEGSRGRISQTAMHSSEEDEIVFLKIRFIHRTTIDVSLKMNNHRRVSFV